MNVLSPIDRKWARLLRADELAHIIPPHEFTQDEWAWLAREIMFPGLSDFARSQEILRCEAEYIQRRFFIEAMLSIYQAGVLLGGSAQTFSNKDTYSTAQTGTAYVVNGVAFFIHAKLWGPGGSAGGGGSSVSTGGAAGGGGFTYDEINTVPGESLTLAVGASGTGGLKGVAGSLGALGGRRCRSNRDCAGRHKASSGARRRSGRRRRQHRRQRRRWRRWRRVFRRRGLGGICRRQRWRRRYEFGRRRRRYWNGRRRWHGRFGQYRR
jgi:hypothetical protein